MKRKLKEIEKGKKWKDKTWIRGSGSKEGKWIDEEMNTTERMKNTRRYITNVGTKNCRAAIPSN